MLNMGSIPPVQPAIVLIVPVGAIVVTVAFRNGGCSYVLPWSCILCALAGQLCLSIYPGPANKRYCQKAGCSHDGSLTLLSAVVDTFGLFENNTN
jgi:hypothetical protein